MCNNTCWGQRLAYVGYIWNEEQRYDNWKLVYAWKFDCCDCVIQEKASKHQTETAIHNLNDP